MTLKEATEAASNCAPVIHNGIEYERITEAGYQYDKNGKRSCFVQLLDRCGHSVTYADPERCKLRDKPTCVFCGKEYTRHGHNAMPVKEGRCCDTCNTEIVTKERIRMIESQKPTHHYTASEWEKEQYKGRWADSPYYLDMVANGEIPEGYIGRRNVMVNEGGTTLLTEGYHFTVDDEEGQRYIKEAEQHGCERKESAAGISAQDEGNTGR